MTTDQVPGRGGELAEPKKEVRETEALIEDVFRSNIQPRTAQKIERKTSVTQTVEGHLNSQEIDTFELHYWPDATTITSNPVPGGYRKGFSFMKSSTVISADLHYDGLNRIVGHHFYFKEGNERDARKTPEALLRTRELLIQEGLLEQQEA